MEAKARLSSIRISTRKVNELARTIRGKNIQDAMNILQFSKKRRVADKIRTLVKSAVANAEQKGTMDIDLLYIKSIQVGQGATLKRFMTRAKGSASRILKRTSHVDVVLGEK